MLHGQEHHRVLLAVTGGKNSHLYTGLDVDGGDLLDDLGGGVEVDHPLVDPQLEPVPGLGTLSARSLSGGDSQGLGWHSDGSLDLEVLVLGSSDEVTAHLLQRLDIPENQICYLFNILHLNPKG